MAVTDKQMLVQDMQKALYDKLTQKDIDIVSAALIDSLTAYGVERESEGAGRQDSDDLVKMFLDAKRVSGSSEKTIEHYRYVIGKLREKVRVPLNSMTIYHLRGYLMDEKDRGLSDSTLSGCRDIFNSLFGWLHREGLIPSNPCANLAPIKKKKEVRKPFTNVEIETLKEASTSLRDKAIITFLLSTGCRISEVCSLNRRDIDLRALECTVLGKGNKERTVYIDPVCAMMLQKYFNSRKDSSPALFAGRQTERMTPHGIRERLNKIADIANVENVHPHRFRRTLATNLINRGMALQEVARILGHEKIDTTMKYVYVNDRDVKNNYRKYI